MAKSVSEYLSQHPEWAAELEYLRQLMLSTEAEETLKWGMPTYMVNGKNVMGIAAFKSYVGIWFHQGVFLSDHAQVLHAAEDSTKAQRQWRFSAIEEMNPALILSYLQEAIQNQKMGLVMAPAPKKGVEIPQILAEAMEQDSALDAEFHALTTGRQREVAEYIGSAKREATRRSRLEKCIPLIRQGKGPMDKYRK